MATGLGALLDLQEDLVVAQVGSDDENTNKDKIDNINKRLKELSLQRKEINSLKYQKDELIKEYISSRLQPNRLELDYINYKALFFYFKNEFIETTNTIELSSFNDEEYHKEDIFIDFFSGREDDSYIIQTLYTNFPHLIGFKNDNESDAANINSKLNDDFLNKIFYETNLIEDYQTHGCDLNKIQVLSWIKKTLSKPNYIFDQSGISSHSKLKTSLVFVRLKHNTVHYVSLQKIQDNYLVINSQHTMGISRYKRMFIEENAIVKRK